MITNQAWICFKSNCFKQTLNAILPGDFQKWRQWEVGGGRLPKIETKSDKVREVATQDSDVNHSAFVLIIYFISLYL